VSEEAALKRLRFAYHPMADESVSGAFAMACHDQRLRSIASALQGGGIDLPRPGSMQWAPSDVLATLAAIMRTDVTVLQGLAFASTGRRELIAVGDLILPRAAIELDRRRIGPKTLLVDERHLSAWLNRLLPFCPASLELLVDSCPTCGPLGWRYTRGVSRCEECGQLVPPSSAAPLSCDRADDYRLFAKLVARNPEEAAAGLCHLSSELQAFSRTTLVGILVRAGIVFGPSDVDRSLSGLLSATPDARAAAMCTGVGLLKDWPTAIQTAVDGRLAEMGDDLGAYEALRVDLRWIGDARTPESQALLATAFPTLDGRAADPFAKGKRYYTAAQANTFLWTSSKELEQLREAEAIRFEKLPSKLRLRARYDADDVDELRIQLRSCESPASAAVRLDLPGYAIGQLSNLLKIVDHPGVVTLRGPQVDRASVDALLVAVRDAAMPGCPPSGHMPLRIAMLRFPGEKPWGRIADALVSNNLPYHLLDGEPSIRACHVHPDALARFSADTADPHGDPLAITHVSLRDACELVGAKWNEAMATFRSANIEIVSFGRGKGVDRAAIADLVATVAFTSEAAAYTGRPAISINRELVRLKVPRLHEAWSRAAMAERGLVSALEDAKRLGA